MILTTLNTAHCNNYYFRSGNNGKQYVLTRTTTGLKIQDFRIHSADDRRPHEYLFKINATSVIIHPDHKGLTAKTIDDDNKPLRLTFDNSVWEQ